MITKGCPTVADTSNLLLKCIEINESFRRKRRKEEGQKKNEVLDFMVH